LKYIFRNATRNKLRSGLTALSLGICLAMMTVLYGFVTLNDELIPELARANRMIVMSNDGFTSMIPITVLDMVRKLPGVQAAVPLSWYLGMYKDEKMPTFAQLATDPKELLNVWVEFKIDPEQLSSWQATRNGCLIDRRNAQRRGWKIGEHIPLKGNNFPVDLDLTLCGIYDGPEFINDLYFHYEYLDELLRQRNSPKAGTTSILFVKATSGEVIPSLCAQIDDRYKNSENPTLTQSHQAFAQAFSKFVGNLQVYVRNIGLAVVFSLTLVAGNAMAMSMRERTTEIAVLKAIGFQRGLVLVLVLGESLVISLVGGVFGVGVGRGAWRLVYTLWPQYIPIDRVAPVVLVYGVAIAAVVGIASGLVPAVRAAQLSVIAGLRKVV
ncbi:MAG: ABC transporter permease, partial [Planctomycetes bacterium]|nr:ABC transporter permease [Planctomycetota bacterium]